MGSKTSSVQQTQCCGLIYDYKRATQKLKIDIDKYKESLDNNLGQFNGKNQQSVRKDFNKAQQQAYQLIKDERQLHARKLLKDLFKNQKQDEKQGKLLTRQIDFLTKKQRELKELKQNIDSAPKPNKKAAQRDQMIQFHTKLEQIQSQDFQNVDQISGDSGDYESYIDRVIEKLKTRIESQSRALVSQKSPDKQASVLKEPVYNAKQLRDMFLQKLRRSGSKSDRTFRKLTRDEIEFFRSKMSIQLGRNLTFSQNSMKNSKRNQNSPTKSGFRYDQQSNNQSSVFLNLPDEAPQSSNIISKHYDEQVGYYLNCNSYHHLDVPDFVKCDWSVVEVLDLQQCSITSFDWKILTQTKSTSLPNLKVLYLGLNQIMEVNQGQLQNLKGIKYISFGWWDKSNQLSSQSKKVLANYQSKNPSIKIQFNQF